MSEMTEAEILDDQIYLSDLRGELKTIEERREDILHQIKCYENKLQQNETKNQETKDMAQEEKPTDTTFITAEEIDDRIYFTSTDMTQEEIEERIHFKYHSKCEDEWNGI